MTQDELLTMERDTCIVQIIGKRPFKDKKYDLTIYPDINTIQKGINTGLTSTNTWQHLKKGKLKQQKIVLLK